LIIGVDRYHGTPGLWDLLTSVNPILEDKTDDDLDNYGKLMTVTNAMSKSGNINSPLSSGGNKWKKIISPIWNSVEAKKKRKQDKKAHKKATQEAKPQKKKKDKAFSQVTQTLCVNSWNC